MSAKLKITVEGSTGAGKSSVAYAIQETLEKYGFLVELTDTPGEPPLLACDWDDRLKQLGDALADVDIEVRQCLPSRQERVVERAHRLIESLDHYKDAKKIKRLTHALTEISRAEDAKDAIEKEGA